MRWPLRNQIMLPVLAVALASILSVGGINAWLSARQTRGRIETQLRGVVEVLGKSSFPLTSTVLKHMQRLSGADFALVDRDDRLLATTLDDPEPHLGNGAAAASADQLSLEKTITIAGRDYFHWPVRLTRIVPSPTPRVLHILFPRDQYQRAIRSAIVTPLAVSLFSTAAVALVAHLIAGRFARTTTRLGSDVQRLAAGDFAPLALPSRDDELRDLTVAVNQTAQRLAGYESQVRHTERLRTLGLVGAGLAHEMRNATTGCGMALDLHAASCATGDDESLAVARRQLHIIESQLRRFLQQSEPVAAVRRSDADLCALVDDAIALIAPAARHYGVELRWRRPDGELIVCVDAESIRQLVLNLALNAVESAAKQFASRDASRLVEVKLHATSADDGAVELQVSDTGPGPDPQIAEALYQPFVTTKPEGVGLGLAQVRRVAQAHGGSVSWDRHDGRTRFLVKLPLAAKRLSCV